MSWQRVVLLGLAIVAVVVIILFAPEDVNSDVVAILAALVGAIGGSAIPTGSTPKHKRILNPKLPHALLAVLLLLGGCAANKTTLDAADMWTRTDPGSAAFMNTEGDMGARYQGVPPTHLNQGAEGTWMTTPGQGGVITYSADTNTVYIWSPKDSRLEDVSFTPQPEPGKPAFTARSIDLNLSNVAAVYAEQFAMAMSAIEGMTKAEAEAQVEKLRLLGEISGDVAETITRSVIPYLP